MTYMKRISVAVFLIFVTSNCWRVFGHSVKWAQAFVNVAFSTSFYQRKEQAAYGDHAALRTKGRWVLDSEGKPIAPPVAEGRMQGLQTSGLAYDGKLLWAVGDQRSNFAGHIFRIDPATARLVGDPVKLDLGEKTLG